MKIERFHETISQLLGTLPQISSHAVKSSTMSGCLVVQVFKESSTQGFNQSLLKQYVCPITVGRIPNILWF